MADLLVVYCGNLSLLQQHHPVHWFLCPVWVRIMTCFVLGASHHLYNAGLLSFGILGTYFIIKIQQFSYKKISLKKWSAQGRSFCLSFSMLTHMHCIMHTPKIVIFRADSRFAPSQWETALFCNDISHWLGSSGESALIFQFIWPQCYRACYFYSLQTSDCMAAIM